MNSSNNNTTTMKNDGDYEKVAAMLVLGIGSFLSGMVPAIISARNRQRFPLTMSVLLCFGAGILMATAIVHILPEARAQLSSNYAEISLCAGFFIIYFIDEFIHYFFGEVIRHSHSHDHNTDVQAVVPHTSIAPTTSTTTYGAVVTTPLINVANRPTTTNNIGDSNNVPHQHNDQTATCIAEPNARMCHTSHTEPCARSMAGTLGLFVALSVHSTIEGVAIGVQNSASKVLFLLGAVSCHKFVMGFCLGLEFRSSPQGTIKSQAIGMGVFAMGAVLGIGVGMLLVDVPSSWSGQGLSIVQALAGGTLLYVTVCEVIPREKARWHQNTARKTAGLIQFLAIAIGFLTTVGINALIDDHDI